MIAIGWTGGKRVGSGGIPTGPGRVGIPLRDSHRSTGPSGGTCSGDPTRSASRALDGVSVERCSQTFRRLADGLEVTCCLPAGHACAHAWDDAGDEELLRRRDDRDRFIGGRTSMGAVRSRAGRLPPTTVLRVHP